MSAKRQASGPHAPGEGSTHSIGASTASAGSRSASREASQESGSWVVDATVPHNNAMSTMAEEPLTYSKLNNFDTIDTNGDGVIDQEEWEVAQLASAVQSDSTVQVILSHSCCIMLVYSCLAFPHRGISQAPQQDSIHPQLDSTGLAEDDSDAIKREAAEKEHPAAPDVL